MEKIYKEALIYPTPYCEEDGSFKWSSDGEQKKFGLLPKGEGGLYKEKTKRINDWVRAKRLYDLRQTHSELTSGPMVCFPHCNPVLACRADVFWNNTNQLIMLEENRSVFLSCEKNLKRNMKELRKLARNKSVKREKIKKSLMSNIDFFSPNMIDFRTPDWNSEELAENIWQLTENGVRIWDMDIWNFSKKRIPKFARIVKTLSPNSFIVRVTMWPRNSIQERIDYLVEQLKDHGELVDQLALRHRPTTEQKGSIDPFIWQGVFLR